jgi:hypothetical protein
MRRAARAGIPLFLLALAACAGRVPGAGLPQANPALLDPGPPTDSPLRAADRARLIEAFRLMERVTERVWPGWSDAPRAFLLVTPEEELLLRHPRPSPEFEHAGDDPLLGALLRRARQFPPNLLASFPAVGGLPTIVMGQPENTGRSSTQWVLTALHEHFHQFQSSRAGYYAGVEALELSGGDQTGMWMLNYPFPYDDPGVDERFAALAAALHAALEARGRPAAPARRAEVRAALEALREALSPADHRYFAFQLWQEGVPLYVELQVARRAAELAPPAPAFGALPDAVGYAEAEAELERRIVEGARDAHLARQRRVAFYPMGAALALILDDAAPDWKERYLAEPFDLAPLLGP